MQGVAGVAWFFTMIYFWDFSLSYSAYCAR
jgi:hypothetical protein